MATSRVAGVISSGFHDIDFSRCRPRTILVVGREHPDCWPEPVTLRELGFHFNSAVLELEALDSSNSGRSNWVVDISRSGSISLATIEGRSSTEFSW